MASNEYVWRATIEVQVMSNPELPLTDHDLDALAEKVAIKVSELGDANPGADLNFGVAGWKHRR